MEVSVQLGRQGCCDQAIDTDAGCAGYLTQAQGLITTDASRASFISTFTVRLLSCLIVVARQFFC